MNAPVYMDTCMYAPVALFACMQTHAWNASTLHFVNFCVVIHFVFRSLNHILHSQWILIGMSICWHNCKATSVVNITREKDGGNLPFEQTLEWEPWAFLPFHYPSVCEKYAMYRFPWISKPKWTEIACLLCVSELPKDNKIKIFFTSRRCSSEQCINPSVQLVRQESLQQHQKLKHSGRENITVLSSSKGRGLLTIQKRAECQNPFWGSRADCENFTVERRIWSPNE